MDLDQPLFIHFSFENFKSVYMGKIKNTETMSITKMVALNYDIRFFYTCDWK